MSNYTVREEDTLLFLMKEASYGAGGTFAGTDAMSVVSVSMQPLQGNIERVHQVRGFRGATRGIRTEKYVGIEIVMSLAGSGTATTPPLQNLLYLGSSHGATVGASDVTYSLISANEDSLYAGFFAKDRFHAIKGLRGGISFRLGTDGTGKVVFSGIGLYTGPVKQAPVTPDFSNFRMPMDINASTVTIMTLFGQDIGMAELNITGRDTAEYLNVVNQEEVLQSSTNGASFTATFREGDLSDHNFFDDAESLGAGALAFQLGTDVTDEGDIFQFNGPSAFIESVDPVTIKGISFLRCSGPLVPTAGNDDYTFLHR